MNDLRRPLRLQVMLLAGEIAAIDDFRFTHRLPSRAAAIRELLTRGFAATEKPAALKSSSCYGVIASRSASRPQRND
jgi:hypothetical protein